VTALEQLARATWHLWGNYAKCTFCSRCGQESYCRAKRQSGPWLCLDCHDLKG
jgi:hypothetical protein